MSQSTISTNGHGFTTTPLVAAERRQTVNNDAVGPETLVQRHVDSARRQLAEAREQLKAARRRVVQLEDAVDNWERFAAEVRERGPGTDA
jgi:phage shock protein A